MGQTLSFLYKFLVDQIFANLPETHADLTGRTFLVTGSNTGIGLGLATHLARLQPAHLILAVRDLKKGEAAKQSIIAQTGFNGSLEVWELDMADFSSVKRFAERVNATLKRLDGVNLNAGVSSWKRTMSADGWERMLQVNALAPGLLAVLLLPLLQATTRLPPPHPDASQTPPHLTFTGSSSMFMATFSERSATKLLEALNDKSQSSIMDRYPTSKLFNLYVAREIVKLPEAQGVVVNVVDPGFCASELGRDLGIPSLVLWILNNTMAWTPEKGALNLLYALLLPTPPAAYVTACAVYPSVCVLAHSVLRPPSWTQTKEGLDVQARAWSEMIEVWKGIAPEVSRIVAP
ncbi:hypothetical protein C8F04DRAFT_1112742 [Mycena alexandri]|uniref:NAD(P)-binding protein n=1 Tax=Mycena alexandri TaxID=1745969 RepID=A0AAD6SRU1_9AGAR|nr:hypothetical protein C8F04DRAFT_1112742 [Mycena alexandri]